MSPAIMDALTCWPLKLSPLNELYRGKLLRSITLKNKNKSPLYSLRSFDDNWYTYYTV